jgi:hypothetical protein
MKAALATLTTLASLALPATAQEYAPIEVCRPATDNVVQRVTQFLAYPTTQVCTRPRIDLHNNISRPNSMQELLTDVLSTQHRFKDISGNQSYPCPRPNQPNLVCWYK